LEIERDDEPFFVVLVDLKVWITREGENGNDKQDSTHNIETERNQEKEKKI
jgi:hypothetical protein